MENVPLRIRHIVSHTLFKCMQHLERAIAIAPVWYPPPPPPAHLFIYNLSFSLNHSQITMSLIFCGFLAPSCSNVCGYLLSNPKFKQIHGSNFICVWKWMYEHAKHSPHTHTHTKRTETNNMQMQEFTKQTRKNTKQTQKCHLRSLLCKIPN